MLAATVLSTLALAPLGLLARRGPRPLIGWGLALLPLALFAAYATLAPQVLGGASVEQAIPWAPAS